ncbi:biopolymer transporter ExbD [Rhodocaloribacter litoris]|uniref:ExbD/TolR family protein n=1 Tax=Rhodocaloribacter litoris TaxID=2558931 RepID=UPI00142077D5|nr:biopolymer transporter ExbD [Rhodocaloribacter litoris]QXD15299.1 biopolymer transporter ExbD [Rhodocaloribacter litoris]GIV62302.1 MAG: biopolymer transporter ExbD [Rhodothermaceae bacterium]
MSTHFKKKSKTSQEIPTASMPDIIFMLLIFFMVSTVLRETTVQVRTRLPQAEAITKIEQKRLISYIWIGPRKLANNRLGETAVQIDDALIEDISTIRTIMWRKLNEQPKLIVSLRVDETSEMGTVLDVQQELREAGTLRINYSTKRLLAS